ncbi:hypothetical protein GCM10027447_02340 [Glycomyces halotolerans]
MSRIFAAVGIVFGTVFVFLNAGGLPDPWDVAARVAGAGLVAAAVWFGLIRSGSDGVRWSGSYLGYWIAVGAEAVAIPVGAQVLVRVLDRPDLVVLWVVFVVGAHFLPARVFGFGRFGELGAAMMVLAIVAGALRLGAGAAWAPSAAAVLAGVGLLVFAAVPALSRPSAEAAADTGS